MHSRRGRGTERQGTDGEAFRNAIVPINWISFPVPVLFPISPSDWILLCPRGGREEERKRPIDLISV
jgi:hypothetical protein